MALIRALSGNGGGSGGSFDYEIVSATIPAKSTSPVTVNLTKGKTPQAVFVCSATKFLSTIDSNGINDIDHLYDVGQSYAQSNLSVSSTQLTWSGYAYSSYAQQVYFYPVY